MRLTGSMLPWFSSPCGCSDSTQNSPRARELASVRRSETSVDVSAAVGHVAQCIKLIMSRESNICLRRACRSSLLPAADTTALPRAPLTASKSNTQESMLAVCSHRFHAWSTTLSSQQLPIANNKGNTKMLKIYFKNGKIMKMSRQGSGNSFMAAI